MKSFILSILFAFAHPVSANPEKKDNLAWDRVTANFYLMGD
tara:strand:+ start:246 stop:368 length:123 start_codon:yes stop_codon:yes gene_type:complete